jgi:hypothetical protein
MKRSTLGPLALALGLAALGGCASSGQEKIVIGEYGSLTGTDATFGGSTKDGVQVAWDELPTGITTVWLAEPRSRRQPPMPGVMAQIPLSNSGRSA